MPAEETDQRKTEKAKTRRIAMSNHQYAMLRYVAFTHKEGRLSLDEVSWLNQGTLGSMKRALRGYITETRDKRGVEITKAGRDALRNFENDDNFFRQQPRMEFSRWLSLEVLAPLTHRARVVERKPAPERSTPDRKAAL